MTHTPRDQGSSLSSLTRQLSPKDVTIDVTRCGLLVERAKEFTRLYTEHEKWNDVTDFQPEDRWDELFDWVASTEAWECLENHGDLDFRLTEEPYSCVRDSGEA